MLSKKTKKQQLYLLAFVMCCHLVGTLNALVEFKGAEAINNGGIIDSEMVKIR